MLLLQSAPIAIHHRANTNAPIDSSAEYTVESEASPDGISSTPSGISAQRTRIVWRNGSPVATSPDGGTTFRLLGQVIADAASTSGAKDVSRNMDRTGIRTAHLGFAGTIENTIVYQFETEFAGGRPDILWAYIGWRGKIADLDADILVGNLQNDRSVEGSSGGEALPFAEPNFVASAIAPNRGAFALGTQFRLIGPDWHASFAVTGDDIDARQQQSGNRTILARTHWNPVKRDRTILHLGAWTFDESFRGGTRTLGADTNVAHSLNLRTILPSPPLAGVRGDHGYGLEAGGVFGPFWTMGEAGRRVIDLPQNHARTTAKSLSAGWMVTGESPPYAAATGGFTRPVIKKSVFQGGSGQVEITGRYEDILFRMPGFRNQGSSVTGGVNWYLSSLMRVMVNATAWRMRPDRQISGSGPQTDHGTTIVLRGQIVF